MDLSKNDSAFDENFADDRVEEEESGLVLYDGEEREIVESEAGW